MKMTMQPLTVACPCGVEIDVPVDCVLTFGSELGQQYLQFHPDFSDLWAHAWTHPDEVET